MALRAIFARSPRQSGPALSKLLGVPMAQLRCTANEMSRYFSANATFLSIIATSPAVHGDLPQDFNGNNVQIGRTNKGIRVASVGDWKRFVDANY